ncbi:hypothetical protein [Vibrio owensii]|uniref:hypothetical protein n=1 Tax=Vibrio owensii TaxID=696485 RepID=UPI003DA12D90
MTKLTELDLEFDFSGAVNAYQFDSDELHGASNGQRVDFIAEYNDRYRFIEVKDPDHPEATNPEAFVAKFSQEKLVNSLAGKFRDTFFFKTQCSEYDQNKKIDYIVLLSCAAIEDAMMLTKQDLLHQKIPIQHARWTGKPEISCTLMNLQKYKEIFGSDSVRRISEGAE